MHIPSHIIPFWKNYLLESKLLADTPLYDVFHFDDNELDANELGDLVLQGKKQATASLLWEYGGTRKRQPTSGDLSVVTNWNGTPICVILTTEVEVTRYDDVDEEFAAAEGEGDLSLKYWRDAHWTYFGRVCEEFGHIKSPDMLVVCERFVAVFPMPVN